MVLFFSFGVSLFSLEYVDNFIEGYYWYQKYLSLEYISDYHALRSTLVYLKTSDTYGFNKLSNDLARPVSFLDNKVMGNLQREKERVSPKIYELSRRYEGNTEVRKLANQFLLFERDVISGKFPQDDSCLDEIDKLYARLITRLGYNFLEGYLVLEGDSLRKIATERYGNERFWSIIWRDEINIENKKFLPNPETPDLIHPGERIRIPPLQEKL